MLTNEKACEGVNDDHIVRQALLQWNYQAGHQATVPPSVENPSVPAGKAGEASLRKPSNEVSARFKDTTRELIWITGHDIIGLFHMQYHQLQRFGVKDTKRSCGIPFRTQKFYPYQFYEVALRTPNCPIDETPDEAVERYLEKIKRSGEGKMSTLKLYCGCRDCDGLRSGPTMEGERFYKSMEKEML
jgi:hypothetical protein